MGGPGSGRKGGRLPGGLRKLSAKRLNSGTRKIVSIHKANISKPLLRGGTADIKIKGSLGRASLALKMRTVRKNYRTYRQGTAWNTKAQRNFFS